MNPLKRLFSFIKPYKIKFTISIIFTFIYTFARSSQPFIIGLIISELAKNVKLSIDTGNSLLINFSYINFMAILLVITAILDATGDYLSTALLSEVVQRTMLDIRITINNKINKLPVSYFDSKQQGEILSRVTNDVDTIGNAIQQGSLRILGTILTIIFSIFFMFLLSPFFTLIALIIFPICFFAYKRFLKKSQPMFQNLQNILGDLYGFIQEYYTGFAVVKLYGQEEAITEKFENIVDDLFDVGFKSGFMSSSISPILSSIVHLAYIGLFLLLVLTVSRNPLVVGGYILVRQMEIGAIQSFIQYVWQSGGPISNITQLSGVFQTGAASLSRVFNILDEKEEIEEKEKEKLPIDIDSLKGNVTFENVAFGYKENELLMEDISFTVKQGETIAVVGPTGAGKTTLINLLMRFYNINSGKITVDGIDINDMTRKQVRSIFGLVLQDPWLYYATIADNIRFGKLDANDYEVVDAAKTANVHHFIRTLPEAYGTMLNKESSNVSQGQKQLLTIARVLIGNPKIIILDEATSSVDTRLEILIQKAMQKTMEGKTSFIIAHRLSTIRDADLILVMNHGSIVEKGNHEELLKQNGMYKQLYESQFSEEEE